MIRINDYVDKAKKKAEGLVTGFNNSANTVYSNAGIEPPKQPAQVTTKPYTPPPVQTAPPVTPFSSTSGSNVKAYIDNKSANLGKDPGYTTEAGRLAADRITKGLTGPDASSVNVQNTADTNASRRQYMANLQAGEAIGQSGFGQGTAQADRIRMNSQAGVNSANQEGQNSANEYLRRRTDSNLAAAGQLESQQYNKGRIDLQDSQGQDLQEYGRSETATDRGLAAAAVTYAQGRDKIGDAKDTRNFDYSVSKDQKDFTENTRRWDTETGMKLSQQGIDNARWDTETGMKLSQQGIDNARWETLNEQNKAQRDFENAQVLKNGNDLDKRNLINSLPDGPAKNAAIAALGQGKPISEVISMIYDQDGKIKIAGETPAKLALEAEMETAGQQAELEGLAKNSREYLDRQKEIVLAGRASKAAPVTEAEKAAVITKIKEKDARGETLTPEETKTMISSGEYKKYDPGSDLDTSKLKALVGETININGEAYKVLETNSLPLSEGREMYGKNSAVAVIGPDGKKRWISKGKFIT